MKNNTIKENVEIILRDFPETRNSDKLLMLKYWELVDGIDVNSSFNNFKHGFLRNSTNTESIRRARQIIQQDGKYLPNDEVTLSRRKKETLMKEKIIKEREVI